MRFIACWSSVSTLKFLPKWHKSGKFAPLCTLINNAEFAKLTIQPLGCCRNWVVQNHNLSKRHQKMWKREGDRIFSFIYHVKVIKFRNKNRILNSPKKRTWMKHDKELSWSDSLLLGYVVFFKSHSFFDNF